ncbi:MAG: sodium:solute symporter family protein [Candidatus Bipolaricaulota bacterium]|nr:sodium:solute symporter family protein [Candidatus Bipolaricaulota bacterium]
MAIRIAVVTTYLGVLLGIGLLARARRRTTPDDYFLASRTLPGWILFLTMAATNFSAFTVFGFSGAGWRIGYAFYPIMAFGTGFMALSFVLIGHPTWRLGKEHGLVTPPELVFQRTKSPALRLVFFLVMAAFTLPYLAIQPMAAGYALASLFGIPYYVGAVLVTAVILAYVLLGGFRGEVWTDIFQGTMMIVFMTLGLLAVAAPFGGIAAANRTAATQFPALFSRPGLDGTFTPGIWFGYMILWFLCDPMFPQLFQRFYAAKNPRALSTTMALYPLVTGFLFLLPVAIGVMGRLSYPQLPTGVASDQILPLLLHKHATPLVETLVLSAGLAALITTLDSQLLTLSSMFTRDVYAPLRARFTRNRTEIAPSSEWVGRAFVVVLGLAGLALAYRPPTTFLEITTEAFTGLAVLFPTVIAAIYWSRMTPSAAIASIVVGEGLVAAYHVKALPTFGTLPVVPVVVGTTLVLVAGSFLTKRREPRQAPLLHTLSRKAAIGWAGTLALFFLASQDVWAWGDDRLGWWGFPWWVWFSAGLCIALSVAFWVLGRALQRPDSRGR